ncbi:hypothetical protein LMG28614_00710 [Paraburkholderia ultramafica]|uniref:Uncharacterized protein n=1 Tax=Paraburkholderia ultramafica TaxID=1544867 RepID=A0A6S7B3S5_9BURK|nr:hypothetical protein LMG28614_00710 [Paraburkholderia ultramafica]
MLALASAIACLFSVRQRGRRDEHLWSPAGKRNGANNSWSLSERQSPGKPTPFAITVRDAPRPYQSKAKCRYTHDPATRISCNRGTGQNGGFAADEERADFSKFLWACRSLVQQAVLQVLQKHWDLTFSEANNLSQCAGQVNCRRPTAPVRDAHPISPSAHQPIGPSAHQPISPSGSGKGTTVGALKVVLQCVQTSIV